MRALSSLATVSPDQPNSWLPIAINPTAWDVLSSLFLSVCSRFFVIFLIIVNLLWLNSLVLFISLELLTHKYNVFSFIPKKKQNDIIDDVIKFNNKGFGYLSSNYMMSGLTNDVNSDERIFGIIVRFFTVLLYRLHYLDNSSPLTHYDVSVINRNDINSLNCAIECILILEYWISEKTVKKATEILGFNYDGSNEDIQNMLNNFKVNKK